MKKFVVLVVSVLLTACATGTQVNSKDRASEQQLPEAQTSQVENPYCDSEFKSYQVVRVLPDFVLVQACKKTQYNQCNATDKKTLMLFKENGQLYTKGEILTSPDVFCPTYIKDYPYTDETGKPQTAPAFMFLPKNIEKSFLQQIKDLRGEPLESSHLLTFSANSKAGFQWGYLLYLPEHIDTSRKLPILFIMNNSGVASSNEEMQKNTLEHLHHYEKKLADQLGVPLLVPFVLREGNDLYPHELNRAVFVLQDGPFKRLDLQVVNMFKDARRQLQKKGISTQQKMLVAGCSASGAFAWRFTLLQPKYVLATAAAVQHYPTLPLEELKGEELIFPIGVADVKQYTGRAFDKQAWKQIPIFIIEGGADYNDPLPYDECFPGEQRTLVHKLYDDEDDTQARVRNVHKELAQIAPNVQTHIYPNMGHQCMVADAVHFLQENQNGGPIKRITPTDTSAWPAPLPLHVSALYWGRKAPLTHDQQHLSATDLTLQIQKSSMARWVRKRRNCRVDVLQQGKEILHDKVCNGIFHEGNFDLFQVSFSADEVFQLKKTGKSTFSLRSHYPKIVDIPTDLTFTIK